MDLSTPQPPEQPDAPEFFAMTPSKAGEESNVSLMAQLLDMKEMVGKFTARVVDMGRERKAPVAAGRESRHGLALGVTFDDDDEEEPRAAVEELRAEAQQHLSARPKGTPSLRAALAPTRPEAKGPVDRDELLLSAAQTLEAIESRMTRPTYDEDLLHFND